MDNNKLNVKYLAREIVVTAENEERLFNLIIGKDGNRMKMRNIAISCLKHFVDIHLGYSGYRGYTCTNAHLMQFDKEHGNTLTEVLDIVERDFQEIREEYK